MRKYAILGVGALALGLTAFPALAEQQNRKSGDLPGPIDNIEDLQDTGRMLFKLADENNDGQISQKEAIDAGNLLVGGFFFRADQNGDGVLSKDEARQAREAFLSSKPWLRYVVETARSAKNEGAAGAAAPAGDRANTARTGNTGNRNLLASVAGAFDTNNDGQLQASELRQAVTTAVQGSFATADTNRDGQLSTTEVNAAIAGVGRQVAQASFQQADTDGNGQISQAEFEKAIAEPARVAFKVMDLNHDGQISMQEAQTARQVLMAKVRSLNLPEAGNSPRNMINSAIGNQTQPGGNQTPPAGTPAPASNPR